MDSFLHSKLVLRLIVVPLIAALGFACWPHLDALRPEFRIPLLEIENNAQAGGTKENLVPLIVFETDVTEASVTQTIQHIHEVNDAGAKTIVMVINSPGGSVLDGWRLARAMEDSPAPVVCVVDGWAASMGFYLLQSCDVRLMTKRSMLMAHEPAIRGGGGTEHDYKEMATLLQKMNRALAEHAAARMHMTVAEFMDRTNNTDWWMNWDEAFTMGAVDGVVDRPREVLEMLREQL